MVGPMVMVGGAVRVGLTVGGWVRVGLIVGGREGVPLGPIVLGAGDVGLGMIDKKEGGSSGEYKGLMDLLKQLLELRLRCKSTL